MLCKWAMPRLKMLVTGLSPWRSGFITRPVHVELVVDIMQLGHVFLQVHQFSAVHIIPPMLHIHSLIHSFIHLKRYTVTKAIPLQAWTVPEGSRRLRLPDFKTNGHMKVERLSGLRIGRLYSPGNIPGTQFCWRLS